MNFDDVKSARVRKIGKNKKIVSSLGVAVHWSGIEALFCNFDESSGLALDGLPITRHF